MLRCLRGACLLVSLAFIAGLAGACGQGPQLGKITVEPATVIAAGGAASLTVRVSGGRDLKLQWMVQRGSISDPEAAAVVYRAPDSPGKDTVTLRATSGGRTEIESIVFEVIAPPSTPTASRAPTATIAPTDTPSPTFAPTHTHTSTPAPTVTSTATSTPSPTAKPLSPLEEIFPQAADAVPFPFAGQGGKVVWDYVTAPECLHSGKYGLRLGFTVTGDSFAGWGVHWVSTPAKHLDASGFKALTFWVKGSKGGEKFEFGLKDTNKREVKLQSRDFVVVRADDWEQVIVPLTRFANAGVQVDAASLENVSFAVNQYHGSGTICIDDIAFQ